MGDVLGALYEQSTAEASALDEKVYRIFCAELLSPVAHTALDGLVRPHQTTAAVVNAAAAATASLLRRRRWLCCLLIVPKRAAESSGGAQTSNADSLEDVAAVKLASSQFCQEHELCGSSKKASRAEQLFCISLIRRHSLPAVSPLNSAITLAEEKEEAWQQEEEQKQTAEGAMMTNV